MNCRGFTLVESLVAISIMGIALMGLLPSMVTFVDANRLTEVRSEAVAVGQQVMEGLRQQDPRAMPTSGDAPQLLIRMGERQYEVDQHFCVIEAHCGEDSRHVIVEVTYGGETVFELETVFAALR